MSEREREMAHLCVQTQHDDHDEEAHGPQLRHRHHGNRSGEGDEGQTWTCEEPTRWRRRGR